MHLQSLTASPTLSQLISPTAGNGQTSSTQNGSSQASTNSGIDSSAALANENTFLQLLVAQIKNQDPTQPMDSTTFLTQLAQFSQLEQLIGIRQDVSQLDPATGAGAGATTGGTTTGGTTPTGSTSGN